jgi:hypothetical protein
MSAGVGFRSWRRSCQCQSFVVRRNVVLFSCHFYDVILLHLARVKSPLILLSFRSYYATALMSFTVTGTLHIPNCHASECCAHCMNACEQLWLELVFVLHVVVLYTCMRAY